MFLSINKCFIVIILFISPLVGAQNDTIQLKNDDILVGEVKSLSIGILINETPYSDEDFRVEFNKVKELIINNVLLNLQMAGGVSGI